MTTTTTTTTPDYLTTSQAARLLPGRPHSNAVMRWMKRGRMIGGGSRVPLQHVVGPGGALLTIREWIDQHVAEWEAKGR